MSRREPTWSERRAALLEQAFERHNAEVDAPPPPRLIEFRVDTYERVRRLQKKSVSGSVAATAELGPGVPPLPLTGRLAFPKDQRDWYEFVALPSRGQRAFVPSGALITGGDRSWRCEASL